MNLALSDEQEFLRADGLMLFEHVGAEFFELRAVFGGEDGMTCGQAVFVGIGRAACFPFGRARAAGLQRIFAISIALSFSRHTNTSASMVLVLAFRRIFDFGVSR